MKRLVALSLVLLLSIESFAAVVGDNDGAAFITKAEFDSLKSTFQAQIDRYNKSIDNKIDGAISAYLEGVQVAKTVQLKEEFAGKKIMILNLDKIDKLKFGKMNFEIAASSNNWTYNWMNNPSTGINHSSGSCSLYMARVDDNHGEGFETFLVDTDKKLTYSDDFRIHWTATRYLVSHTSSGGTYTTNTIWGRWHASYQQKLTSKGEEEPDYSIGETKFSDLLSNSSWLSFWQTGGVGFQCGGFGMRTEEAGEKDNPNFNRYLTSVNTYDEMIENPIISTEGTSGLKNDVFVCLDGKAMSAKQITQQESLYKRYDTSTYKYRLPSDAGLTTCAASTMTIPMWSNFSGSYKPTLVSGVTWVDYGRYSDRAGNSESSYIAGTAAPFYEMIPKITEVNLDTLKDSVALSGVSESYQGWSGYLYQGIPLYRFDKDGKIKFSIDLSSVTEDVYLAVNDSPFEKTIGMITYKSRELPDCIGSWTVDGTRYNTMACELSHGVTHDIEISINQKTPIFYKFVLKDSNSKNKQTLILPQNITFTSNS